MDMFEGAKGQQLTIALTVAAWLLVAFLAVQVVAGVSGLRYIGAGITPANTISVSGHGEVDATPDIATFSFAVVSDKPTAAAAQTDATAKANATTQYLKDQGIAAKDIQTSGYSVYPKYEYQSAACTGGYCPPGKQVLVGYEARQTTTVKVRDLAKSGGLLAGVGQKGATEVSGLTFTFDDPNAPQAQAREKAIQDAKSKADTLAKELGVSLVRVVSFSESGASPRPIAYGMGGAVTAESAKAPAPEISPGTNTVTDDVTITYEIR